MKCETRPSNILGSSLNALPKNLCMVRHYGYYSIGGKRNKKTEEILILSILEPEASSQEYRKNRARLIQKIFEIDPLTYPKCQGRMKVITL